MVDIDQDKVKTKQAVVRTYATVNDTRYQACSELDKALSQGWHVIMCHPIGDRALEYILEKKVKE